MSRHRTVAKRTAVITAIAATIAGAGLGIAGASIPDSAGVAHACYPTSGALKPLYLIDTASQPSCPTGFSPIDLNNQPGPQGPQGPKGPQGANGAQGPRGPSDAYSASHAAAVNIENGATVVSMTVPAGRYVVNAKTTVTNGGTFSQSVNCLLLKNDTTVLDAVALTLPGHSPVEVFTPSADVEAALQDATTFTTAGTLSLSCGTDAPATAAGPIGAGGGGGAARITATNVAALH